MHSDLLVLLGLQSFGSGAMPNVWLDCHWCLTLYRMCLITLGKQLFPSKNSNISTHIKFIKNLHLNAASFSTFKWKLASCIFLKGSTCRNQILIKVRVGEVSETWFCPFLLVKKKKRKVIILHALKKINRGKIKL